MEVPKEIVDAIGGYLLTRPMQEVEPLVNALRQCAQNEQMKQQIEAEKAKEPAEGEKDA